MAWKAELLSVTKDRGVIVPTVVLSNEETGEKITETPRGDDVDMTKLAAWCKRRIESLIMRDESFATLKVGPIELPLDA